METNDYYCGLLPFRITLLISLRKPIFEVYVIFNYKLQWTGRDQIQYNKQLAPSPLQPLVAFV